MTAPATDPVAGTDWIAEAGRLAPPKGLFIGGEQRPARSGAVHPIVSPRDGATLVELAWADDADADAAVAAARTAFDTGPWPRMPA